MRSRHGGASSGGGGGGGVPSVSSGGADDDFGDGFVRRDDHRVGQGGGDVYNPAKVSTYPFNFNCRATIG